MQALQTFQITLTTDLSINSATDLMKELSSIPGIVVKDVIDKTPKDLDWNQYTPMQFALKYGCELSHEQLLKIEKAFELKSTIPLVLIKYVTSQISIRSAKEWVETTLKNDDLPF